MTKKRMNGSVKSGRAWRRGGCFSRAWRRDSLKRWSKRWRQRMQPHYDAIEASTRITGEDLAVRVGPCRLPE